MVELGKYTFKLDEKEIERVLKTIADVKEDIESKNELFCKKLAERGVSIAKAEIADMSAIDSGVLQASINFKRGDVVKDGCTYYVYTDCEYAKFIEFGTGIVGAQSPHPESTQYNWKYDINNHGESGWWYMGNDGKYHWTKGMPSRPFMHNTKVQLNMLISEVAKEVFG